MKKRIGNKREYSLQIINIFNISKKSIDPTVQLEQPCSMVEWII